MILSLLNIKEIMFKIAIGGKPQTVRSVRGRTDLGSNGFDQAFL